MTVAVRKAKRSFWPHRWLWLAVVITGVVVVAFGVGSASAGRGGGATKACVPTTLVGQKMLCEYTFQSLDTFGDTLKVDETFGGSPSNPGGPTAAVTDQVQAFSGLQQSAQPPDLANGILRKAPIIFQASATGQMPVCVGGSGSGTLADPYVGATSC